MHGRSLQLCRCCSGSGAVWHYRGPLDAQIAFVQFVQSQTLESVDVGSAVNVVEVVTRLVLRFVVSGEQVACRGSSDSVQSMTLTPSGVGASGSKGEKQVVSETTNNGLLMIGLLEFVNSLIQLPVASCGRVTGSQTSDPETIVSLSQLTDALKMDQAGACLRLTTSLSKHIINKPGLIIC